MNTDVLTAESKNESELTITLHEHLKGSALRDSILRQFYLIGIHKFEANMTQVSKYVGVSARTLRSIVSKDPVLKEAIDSYRLVKEKAREQRRLDEGLSPIKKRKPNLLPSNTSRGNPEDLILKSEINRIKNTSTYRTSTEEEKKEILDRVAMNICNRPYTGPVH